MTILRRLLHWLTTPIMWAVLKTLSEDDDPWERINLRIPFYRFGPGSKNRFSWYFEGESKFPVQSVDDICEWLANCQYESDAALFNEDDFWQHPKTFEALRRGDCEDHALWAWRKLIELRLDACLFVGNWNEGASGGTAGHAWVVYKKEGVDYLMETVRKDDKPKIRVLEEAQHAYVPHFSVDPFYKTTAYVGHLLHLKRARNKSSVSVAV